MRRHYCPSSPRHLCQRGLDAFRPHRMSPFYADRSFCSGMHRSFADYSATICNATQLHKPHFPSAHHPPLSLLPTRAGIPAQTVRMRLRGRSVDARRNSRFARYAAKKAVPRSPHTLRDDRWRRDDLIRPRSARSPSPEPPFADGTALQSAGLNHRQFGKAEPANRRFAALLRAGEGFGTAVIPPTRSPNTSHLYRCSPSAPAYRRKPFE